MNPPQPQLGDIVLWYQEGDSCSKPFPAIVTAVWHDTIGVNIFDNTLMNCMVRDGVPHLTDNRCRKVEVKDSGGWDFTPQQKAYHELQKQVAELLKRKA